VEWCVEQFGRIDILVNNAGVIDPIARLDESDPALWAAAVDTNLKGVYFGLRAVIPFMKQQGSGTIINLSSGAANSALEGWSHYCSTKAAVKKLTECAHKEVAGNHIAVIGLSPGTVATDMMAKIRDSGINPVSQLNWESHLRAESAAEAVAFLCTPQAHPYSGTDFSLKTEEGRALVGLT
jgi:NADP-dependent 3-hydroxy acid dehydrogenase YdfG